MTNPTDDPSAEALDPAFVHDFPAVDPAPNVDAFAPVLDPVAVDDVPLEAVRKQMDSWPQYSGHVRRDLTTDDRLDALPVGSTVAWKKTELGVTWDVTKGTNTAHGTGKTLAHAIRMIGAKQVHHPDQPSRFILLDENDQPIHPE